MGTTVNHQPFSGDRTKMSVAIGKIKPVTQEVTLTAQAAKGAASLNVSALTAPIDKGNWLHFVDNNGLEFLARTKEDAVSTATTINVDELAEAITNGAKATFPTELFDRSAVDLTRQYNTKEIFTLNTGGNRQVVSISSNKSVSTPGFWYWHNGGLRICEQAAETKTPIWIFIEYEPPSSAFSKGIIVSGKAIITSLPKASPADNEVSGDVDFEFTGPVSESLPVPVPV
jgi:hypothetical protein